MDTNRTQSRSLAKRFQSGPETDSFSLVSLGLGSTLQPLLASIVPLDLVDASLSVYIHELYACVFENVRRGNLKHPVFF